MLAVLRPDLRLFDVAIRGTFALAVTVPWTKRLKPADHPPTVQCPQSTSMPWPGIRTATDGLIGMPWDPEDPSDTVVL